MDYKQNELQAKLEEVPAIQVAARLKSARSHRYNAQLAFERARREEAYLHIAFCDKEINEQFDGFKDSAVRANKLAMHATRCAALLAVALVRRFSFWLSI
jgi:hypothetical protein